MKPILCLLLALLFASENFAATAGVEPNEIFVEAESFQSLGGWKLDTQFIQQMGSPSLLAHGLGQPVTDAVTSVDVPASGKYRVWVRTIDWVARWNASPSPGKFKVQINGQTLEETFGTSGRDWGWHDGGTLDLNAGKSELRLKDLTGFDGRCDCLYLTTDLEATPPAVNKVLSTWRRGQLGLPETPREKAGYDLVVVGGGYAGMGAAISAARMGCRVALIQDRGVLGGNGSSEVRVWAMGLIRRGKFPRIGEIVHEFADKARKSPGTYQEFGDELKEQIVRAEPNIDLMLHHHAYAVDMVDDTAEGRSIRSVRVLNTKTGEDLRISGNLFADCTGHGWIGQWAGADLDMTPGGRMGMSNMWAWDESEQPKSFPAAPWALDLEMKDFPYPRDHHGQWFWESGFDKDPIAEAEAIRDWNLRAVFGAFNAMKNGDGADAHKNAFLTWVAFVGGPRESRRLMGDVVLTQDDIVNKRDFPDGCVPSTWSIDLHYPKKAYAKKFPDNPFISVAVHDRRVDRNYGYPVPYRCFYSRNIDNLFMAGRCISVTHQALGTVRVMKTCGMMGEVVGKAASICALNDCGPRAVYEQHLDDLLALLDLPGKARRSTPSGEIIVPKDALPLASSQGPMTGSDPAKMEGVVVDDRDAKLKGNWLSGTGLRPYVGFGYRYAGPGTDTKATFTLSAPRIGRYQIGVFSLPHDNRSTRTPVSVSIAEKVDQYTVDQRSKADDNIVPVDEFDLTGGQKVTVTISTHGADGFVHVDAVRLLKVD